METIQPKPTPQINPRTLKTLRGMIIDRDAAWRADPEMAPVIDAAIHKGIENIDAATSDRIYMYLRYGPLNEEGRREPLPGSYATRGYDEKQMAKAWKRYLRDHQVHPGTT